MFIKLDSKAFHNRFSEKLESMLSPDELGAYILVLANSIQDQALRYLLSDALGINQSLLKISLDDKSIKATDDDVDVFNKILKSDTHSLPCWTQYQIGVWEVIDNPFRALRPSRILDEKINSIKKSFDDAVFNFNKPFLRPEIYWQGEWRVSDSRSVDLRVLYNKFPFVPYHLLLVPDAEKQRSQYLTKPYHEMIWNLVSAANQSLPGFAVGYNSMGACSSVNHLHFQSFIREKVLPIELSQWEHNGGDVAYPMQCYLLENMQQAWDEIEAMHRQNIPYHLLYRAQRCYVIPRKLQGSESINAAVSGAGWIEACGVFIAASQDEIELLSEELIFNNLKSLSV